MRIVPLVGGLGAIAGLLCARGQGAAAPSASTASAPSAASVAPPIHVVLGLSQPNAVNEPIYVAAERGFFRQNGLDVEVQILSPTQAVPALLKGDAQINYVGGPEAANSVLGGAPLVMIASASDLPVLSLFANC